MYLISETEKYVWYANVNVNCFPLVFVFLIRRVNIKFVPGPKVILNWYSKLNKNKKKKKKKDIIQKETFLTLKKVEKLYKMYLWGHIFKSSLVGLRIKSVKTLLVASVGKGGGSSSNVHNLFLANPCASRGPRFENCIKKNNQVSKIRRKN